MIVVVNGDEAGGGSALRDVMDLISVWIKAMDWSWISETLSLLVDFIKKYRIKLRDEVQLRPPLNFLRKSCINILHA